MNNKTKFILAIETSCDETAASVISFDNKYAQILSNIVSSQMETHANYGGVVPEVASRMHLEAIGDVINTSLKKAGISLKDLNYIAVTSAPGLIGSLLIGQTAAKTLGLSLKIPVLEINHIDGHLCAALLQETRYKIQDTNKSQITNPKIDFKEIESYLPILSLTVSGGHTQLMITKDLKNYKIIGETLDDAAGEAFDKAAQILGLSYPGGPAISAAAEIASSCHSREGGNLYDSNSILPASLLESESRSRRPVGGNPRVKPENDNLIDYSLPIPMKDSDDFNFSFSGLKTALLYKVLKYKRLSQKDKELFAYNFQKSLVESLILKTISAAKKYKPKTITLAGGVAANKYLRKELAFHISHFLSLKTGFLVPPKNLCTDNAAMIGIAATIRLKMKTK